MPSSKSGQHKDKGKLYNPRMFGIAISKLLQICKYKATPIRIFFYRGHDYIHQASHIVKYQELKLCGWWHGENTELI